MHFLKYICPALLIVFFLAPSQAHAQRKSRFKSKYLKNAEDARRQAITGTLVPIIVGITTATFIENNTVEKTASFLAVYGLIYGPSAGNIYAQDYLRGLLGVAARIGGGILLLDATRELAGDDVADGLGWDHASVSLTDTKVLIGGGIILGSALYNIISSKASVNRFNRKSGYTVQAYPIYKQGKIIPMVTARVTF